MLAVLIVIAVLLAILVLLLARPVLHRPSSWLDEVTGARVLVHTSDDQTFEGSLFGVTADGLLLKAVRLVDDTPINVAGDVFVPRSKIVMIQHLTDGGS